MLTNQDNSKPCLHKTSSLSLTADPSSVESYLSKTIVRKSKQTSMVRLRDSAVDENNPVAEKTESEIPNE
jgi:hypothetical protein